MVPDFGPGSRALVPGFTPSPDRHCVKPSHERKSSRKTHRRATEVLALLGSLVPYVRMYILFCRLLIGAPRVGYKKPLPSRAMRKTLPSQVFDL